MSVDDEIVAGLRADACGGRLRNVAEEVWIAIGEASGHVGIHEANVSAERNSHNIM